MLKTTLGNNEEKLSPRLKSGPYGYYFHLETYGERVGAYDISDFNPSFSNGIISKQDIDMMDKSLQSAPNSRKLHPEPSDYEQFGFQKQVATSCCGGKEEYYSYQQTETVTDFVEDRRNNAIRSVVAQLNTNVFRPKGATLKLSDYGYYLAIEFDWMQVKDSQGNVVPPILLTADYLHWEDRDFDPNSMPCLLKRAGHISGPPQNKHSPIGNPTPMPMYPSQNQVGPRN